MNLKRIVIEVAKKVAVDGVVKSPWWQYYEPEIPEDVINYHDELHKAHDGLNKGEIK